MKDNENAVIFLRNYKVTYDLNVTCKYDSDLAGNTKYGNGYVFKVIIDESSIKLDNSNYSDFPKSLTSNYQYDIGRPFMSGSGGLTSDTMGKGWYNPTNAGIYLGNSYTWSNGKTFKVSVSITITRIYYNGTDNYIDITEANKDNFFFIELEETSKRAGSTMVLDYVDGIHPRDFVKPTFDTETIDYIDIKNYYDYKATITNHFNETTNCEYRSYHNFLTPIAIYLHTSSEYTYNIYGNSDLDKIYLKKYPENSSVSDKVFLDTSDLFIYDKDNKFAEYLGQPTFELEGKTYNSVKIKREGLCTYIPFAADITAYKDINKINCTKVYEDNNLLRLAYKTDFNSLGIVESLNIDFRTDSHSIKTVTYSTNNSEQVTELDVLGIQDVFVRTTATIKSNINQFYKYYLDYSYKVIQIKHFIESVANYIKMHYNSFTIAGGTAEPGSIYLGKFKYITDYLYEHRDYDICSSTIKVYHHIQKDFVTVYVPKSIYLNPDFLHYWLTAINQNCIYSALIHKTDLSNTEYIRFVLRGKYTEHSADNRYNFDYFTVE